MANSLITPTIIAKEALFQLQNHTVMGHCVHRDYRKEFVKIGESVNIRKPVKFTVTDGATRSNQDVTESQASITIDQRKHVSWKFSTQDLTMTVEEYSERYIQPAAIALANKVDADLLEEGAKNFWLSAGTPGTTPDRFSILGDAAQALDDGAVPDDGNRKMVLNPAARWSLADALKGIYDNSMPTDLVRKGKLGNLANFEIFGDQNVYRLTTGADIDSGTPLVNGSTSNAASTLVTDGWTVSTTGVVKQGDVFTLASVNAVNPISKADLGVLQKFVVTADANSDGSGNATISISPSLFDNTDGRQNVSALPADNAALTFWGSEGTTYAQNLAFHKNALALVMVPLELPDSAGFKARVQWDGMSIRVVKDYDIDADEEIIRLDIFYGVDAIYPELGCRVWGS